MDTQLKTMMEAYNVKNATELLKAKTDGKQTRFTMSAQKPTLVEMSLDECKKLCEKAGIQYENGYEHRVIEGVTSNETTDRMGDIIRYKGASFVNYAKNPVVMLSHDHCNFPIGNSIQIWKDDSIKGIKSWDLYVDDRVDESKRSNMAFKFRKSGIMPGISIGFLVLSAKTDFTDDERKKTGLGKWGVEILEWDYLEHSQVSIPANPEALTNMLKSIEKKVLNVTFDKEDLFTIEKLKFFPNPELLNIFEDYTIKKDLSPVFRPYPNEHACRLNAPAKYDEFKRGTRIHDGKSYSIIFGKLKDTDTWEEQAYRYDKDKWEEKDAKTHCDDHKGDFAAATGDKMTLDDGTILTLEGNNIWKSLPTYINAFDAIEKKLDILIEKASSLSASGNVPDSNFDEKLYDGELLKQFEMKPKF